MAPVADYLTINISSPNTPGLRALQEAAALDDLLARATAAGGPSGPPLFLKVAPDLAPADIDAIARVAIERRIGRADRRQHHRRATAAAQRAGARGGRLSGAPLKVAALERLRDFRRATGGGVPLIAAGGIASGADAYARILAGASLVQLYTALVYEGPLLARRIARELVGLLARDGHGSVAKAIGADV